jgi:hypothetical protein
MRGKVLLFFMAAGLAAAGAKTYTMDLFEPALFGSMELKPGVYKVEVVDQKATVRNGKLLGECPVKVETVDRKYDNTSVRFLNNGDGGKLRIQELRIGGTKTKLVFTM